MGSPPRHRRQFIFFHVSHDSRRHRPDAPGRAVPAARAHNLIRAESAPTTWSDPLPIERPDVSQVYYARLEGVRHQVWFPVGVPVIDRLVGLEPLAAIVGPGLPAAAVGFELPPDPGIVAFRDTPTGADDRLWLAIGTKERFGLGDLFRFGAIKRFVRAFHEAR